MKTLALVLFSYALAFTCMYGCATSHVVWPKTVKCTAPITGAVVSEVQRILVNGTGQSIEDAAISALERLAAEHGAELVSCIVQQFATTTERASIAPPTAARADAAARAQDFLSKKGIAIVATPSRPGL